MKKINYLLITILTFFTFSIVSRAAGTASLSVSSSSIADGSSVTAYVSIKNTAAWNITINSAGSTKGCSQKFVGDSGTGQNTNQTFTAICKSTSTGIISFTISGDITSSDGTNTNVSGAKSVTVYTPIPKSTNNYLNSLSVDGVSLKPEFNKDTLEYSIELEPLTQQVKISAAAADSKASIAGNGNVNVVEGINKLNIVVTAENGNQKTYVINATVKEQSPIEITVDGKKFNVIRKKENLIKPETYNETTTKINNEEVPAFISDVTKFTLVGLTDETGKVNLYIYDSGNNTYKIYNEIKLSNLIIYPLSIDNKKLPKDYLKTSVKINDINMDGYQYKKGSEFTVIYGLNVETGKEEFYLYDEKDKTIQRFNIDETTYNDKKLTDYLYVIIAVSSLAIILLVSLIIVIINFRKNMKKINKLPIKKAMEEELGKTKVLNFDFTKDLEKKEDK